MNVLVLGGGGREHVLCERLARSSKLKKLFTLPGNAGTAALGTNIPGNPEDVALALEVARREGIDLTIVGPEAPLAAGVVDAFEEAGRAIFGPNRRAAQLEADKAWAKALMRRHSVPTAEARIFDDYEYAKQYISTRDEPLVVKTAGLAAGKGAIVCDDPAEALLAAERMLVEDAFGPAGRTIVVEERLEGRETSVMAIVDGHTLYMLDPAQDYKRLEDGGRGPNTGGMGAYCPARVIDDDAMNLVETQIFVPTLDALLREDVRFRGVLYAGLMLTAAGPKVLEFNCRFGDPETQVQLPRLRSDLLEVLAATVRGELEQVELDWDPRAAVCVVMASGGYPGAYEKDKTVLGLPDHADDLFVYHAGTRLVGNRVVTSGGRVLGVTALGADVEAARRRAYSAVERIQFEGACFRSDIGV